MTKIPVEEEFEYLQKTYPRSSALMDKAMDNCFNQPKVMGLARKAYETDPDNPEALLFYVSTYEDLQQRLDVCRQELNKLQKKLESQGFWNDDNFGKFGEQIETRAYLDLLSDYVEDLEEAGQLTVAAEQYREILRLEPHQRAFIANLLLRLYVRLEKFSEARELVKATKPTDLASDDRTEFYFLQLLLAYKQGAYDQMPALMSEVNKLNEYLLEQIYFGLPHHHHHDEDDEEWSEDDCCECCEDGCECGDCPCCQREEGECCDCCEDGCDCGDCPCCQGEDEADDGDLSEDEDEAEAEAELRERNLREDAEAILFSCRDLLVALPSFGEYIQRHYEFKV